MFYDRYGIYKQYQSIELSSQIEHDFCGHYFTEKFERKLQNFRKLKC